MKTYTLEELRLAQAKGCRIEYLTVGQAGWVTVESPVYDGGIGCYRIHPDDEWKATPSTPAPDYGEPWREVGSKRIETGDLWIADARSSDFRERIIACVNSMAGVSDPAAFVAHAKEMREAIRKAEEALKDVERRGREFKEGDCPYVLTSYLQTIAERALSKLQPFLP